MTASLSRIVRIYRRLQGGAVVIVVIGGLVLNQARAEDGDCWSGAEKNGELCSALCQVQASRALDKSTAQPLTADVKTYLLQFFPRQVVNRVRVKEAVGMTTPFILSARATTIGNDLIVIKDGERNNPPPEARTGSRLPVRSVRPRAVRPPIRGSVRRRRL
jgi:hypothetical protein